MDSGGLKTHCRDRHWPSREHELRELKAPDTASSSLPQPGHGCITNLCFPEALGWGLPQIISHPEACLPPGSRLAQALLQEHSQRRGWIILVFCPHNQHPKNTLPLSAASQLRLQVSLAPLGLAQSHNLEGGPGKEPLARCAEQILAPKFYGSRVCDQPVGRTPKDTEVTALFWNA